MVSLILLLLACAAHRASAQGTGIVLLSDPVYIDIDRLTELGVIDSVIIGQRPYSRREMARLARVARERLDAPARVTGISRRVLEDPGIDETVRRLEDRFWDDDAPFEEPIATFDAASLSAARTDADRRPFFAPHLRSIEATIDPLVHRRLGTPAPRGSVATLEVAQRLEPTSWLAFQAQERVEYRQPTDTLLDNWNGELLMLVARARYRNAVLAVGRQQVTWAQTADAGLFLASDAPALDQIQLTGNVPFVLPSFLRALGLVQGTILLADLGASVQRSHSKLLTYKLSIEPTSSVELGGTFMNHFGGEGGRPSSLGNRIADFLPFIDVFRKHNYTDTTRLFDVDSDKLLGMDARVRFAQLGGITLAGEMLIDDFDVHRLPKLLTGYGSQTFALIVPQIGSPDWSLKFAAKHMGIITYSHAALLNGITTRGRLLGDELGPDAKAFGAEVRYTPNAALRFQLEGRSAIYSNATYASFYTDAAQTNFVVQKVSHTADELRDRVVGVLMLQADDLIALTVRAGGQRVRNANFQGGRRHDFAAEVTLQIAR